MTLRARLLWSSLVPTLLVLALGGFGLFRASRSVLEVELGGSLSMVAASVASQLNAERVLAIVPEDAAGEGSRTWRSLTRTLTEAQKQTGVRRVLVFDAERKARVDVGGGLPPGAEVPELLRDGAELELVFSGQRTASQVLFSGTDGRFYKTGYAPLLLDGKVVGAVAVEGSAAFFGPLSDLRNAFVALLVLTLLLLVVAAVASAQQVSRPLERLVSSAQVIGQGDLSTAVSSTARTQEVAQLAEALEAMRAGLESRDRQLKLMLGGVAHEVKNPLGGIELFTGLLDEELRGAAPNLPEALDHLRKVRRELNYLKRIVDDFLAFAREQKVAAAPFEVSGFVHGAVAHLQGEASGRGVQLEVQVPAMTAEGDESLLTSALVNLVKNAVQASVKGQTVRVEGRAEAGKVVVEVHDEGPGIPPEVQARIFEPFFTTREQGTGLGLPLARKLVEANGGTLTLESRKGRKVFRLTLKAGRATLPGVA